LKIGSNWDVLKLEDPIKIFKRKRRPSMWLNLILMRGDSEIMRFIGV